VSAGRSDSVALDRIVDGSTVKEGDVVFGVRSNGVHSNGHQLARNAFLRQRHLTVGQKFEDSAPTIARANAQAEAHLRPEGLEILDRPARRRWSTITRDGLLKYPRGRRSGRRT